MHADIYHRSELRQPPPAIGSGWACAGGMGFGLGAGAGRLLGHGDSLGFSMALSQAGKRIWCPTRPTANDDTAYLTIRRTIKGAPGRGPGSEIAWLRRLPQTPLNVKNTLGLVIPGRYTRGFQKSPKWRIYLVESALCEMERVMGIEPT